MTTRVPSLPEVIDAFITSKLADTYHILPGIVVAYYPATQEADIQIAVDDPRFDIETEERIDEPWPIYPRMRVAWPKFGTFVVIGPLVPGNKVQCFFQDLDDSAFRTTGQRGPAPRTRRFGSDSAFCLPWDLTDPGVSLAGAIGVMVMGNDAPPVQILIDPTGITLGSAAVDHIAKAESLAAAVAAAGAAAAAAVVPGDGGRAAFAAFTSSMAGAAASFTSTIAKVL